MTAMCQTRQQRSASQGRKQNQTSRKRPKTLPKSKHTTAGQEDEALQQAAKAAASKRWTRATQCHECVQAILMEELGAGPMLLQWGRFATDDIGFVNKNNLGFMIGIQ